VSLFVTFEGPDGAGKTTQIQLLTGHLQSQGYNVLCTREPGGTAIGDQIRQILHAVDNTAMSPAAEILLYSASRAQLVAQVIKPALAAGGIVLSDRYADSTYAYQGYGRELDLTALKMITEFATQNLRPDLTIYLDLPVEAGLKRKQQANIAGEGEWNRMDQLTLDFHRRVRQGYLTMAQAEQTRWLVIDAEQSIGQIQRVICSAVAKKIAQFLEVGHHEACNSYCSQ
jgi:dTMP kinase